MKITDLKNGAVVETRSGNRYLKVDNTLLNLRMDGGFVSISDYDDNLKSSDGDVDFDIVKVWNSELSYFGHCNGALYQVKRNQPPSWQKTIILDDTEKEYLENVLKPFKNEITNIVVLPSSFDANFVFLKVNLTFGYNHMVFPRFYKGTMYKGMEIGKHYTLDELGLFKD